MIPERFPLVFAFVLGASFFWHGFPHEVLGDKAPELLSIPISSMDVDQATATVSVLEQPHSPLSTVLRVCQDGISEEIEGEGKEIVEDVKELCKLVERFTKNIEQGPAHRFDPKGYVITVPLFASQGGVQAAVWRTDTLDEAITFVELLQSGKLKAVKVYTRIPWGPAKAKECSECPIKELIFQASGIKEQLEILKGRAGSSNN